MLGAWSTLYINGTHLNNIMAPKSTISNQAMQAMDPVGQVYAKLNSVKHLYWLPMHFNFEDEQDYPCGSDNMEYTAVNII